MTKEINKIQKEDDPKEVIIDQNFINDYKLLSARYKRDFTLGTKYTSEGALTTIVLKRFV